MSAPGVLQRLDDGGNVYRLVVNFQNRPPNTPVNEYIASVALGNQLISEITLVHAVINNSYSLVSPSFKNNVLILSGSTGGPITTFELTILPSSTGPYAGIYSEAELITALNTALAANANTTDLTVTFDPIKGRFTFVSSSPTRTLFVPFQTQRNNDKYVNGHRTFGLPIPDQVAIGGQQIMAAGVQLPDATYSIDLQPLKAIYVHINRCDDGVKSGDSPVQYYWNAQFTIPVEVDLGYLIVYTSNGNGIVFNHVNVNPQNAIAQNLNISLKTQDGYPIDFVNAYSLLEFRIKTTDGLTSQYQSVYHNHHNFNENVVHN